MTIRCLDCNLPIEGEPWWYDPMAVGINLGVAVADLKGVVSKQPYPPSSVAGPFHKECLVSGPLARARFIRLETGAFRLDSAGLCGVRPGRLWCGRAR
jgi:hypothetical protein